MPTTPVDLLDLKLMPAWVNEPSRPTDYGDYQGEEERPFDQPGRGPQRERDARSRPPKRREQRDRGGQREQRRPERTERSSENRPPPAPAPLPMVDVRFIPHPAAFESVIAQIKSGTVTYSVFALARMFLDKPERYDVQLKAPVESPLSQLGDDGAVAADQRILEGSAFALTKDDFYTAAVTQSDPIKGNFNNVARDRVSGTLLGPTNHHSYQPQLRGLYEQRYSRRMSFGDYQRQIEIVSDPAAVEAWKEQARSVTTFTTKKVEPPVTFTSLTEVERHFRQTHLPGLLRSAQELTVSGVLSRHLPDRGLGRVIENAWSAEIRSPSKMMQELAGGLRSAGLHIFRHRKGMLFVSPIRIRSFSHESAVVSASINSILAAIAETPGINRKQLAEKMVSALHDPSESDKLKLSLASNLRWLITEGYLLEFNDGSLDLPRAKPPLQGTDQTPRNETITSEPAPTATACTEPAADASLPRGQEFQGQRATPLLGETLTDGLRVDDEAGGMSVDQRIESVEPAAPEAPQKSPATDEDIAAPAPAETPKS
ncbi:MAG: hypothetical protein H0W04_01900 [Chthoniobacterales bacterium]|nr:hypothetical protein [Chthoniobacterales bacterium]